MNAVQKNGGRDVNIIQKKRANANITQEKLAELLGIDRSAVAKWETGVALPRAELLPKVARALNCTVDELLSDVRRENEE